MCADVTRTTASGDSSQSVSICWGPGKDSHAGENHKRIGYDI